MPSRRAWICKRTLGTVAPAITLARRGIACQAGVCEQTVCTSSTSPFSGKQTTGPADWNNKGRQIFGDVNGDGLLDLVAWQ